MKVVIVEEEYMLLQARIKLRHLLNSEIQSTYSMVRVRAPRREWQESDLIHSQLSTSNIHCENKRFVIDSST